MRYCNECLYPDTKPDLRFDNQGTCAACNAYRARPKVDWDVREREFKDILSRHKASGSHPYDCIVPVSGGKDSHYQIIRLLDCGVRPLAVTATTDSLSPLGRRNLQNLGRLGVDHIELTVNPVIRRRINKFTLENVGDISWAEHVTIFTIPVRMAVQLGIPLIIWGENPQNEYGGPAAGQDSSTLTREWLEEFGGLLGLRVSDLPDLMGISKDDLYQYTYPTQEELDKAGVTGLFLGHYFPWDGYKNADIARKKGFEFYGRGKFQRVEGSLAAYENLDNHQTGIHDYFKYLKFGFGRATDIACNWIRRGYTTREKAIKLVSQADGEWPATYLGRSLESILNEIDMTRNEFLGCVERFHNPYLFNICPVNGDAVPRFIVGEGIAEEEDICRAPAGALQISYCCMT